MMNQLQAASTQPQSQEPVGVASDPVSVKVSNVPPHRSRWQAIAIGTALLLSGFTVALVQLHRSTAPSSVLAEATVLPVNVIPVERVTAYQSYQTYTGRVTAARASELGFERSGKLIWLGIDQGEPVQAGEAIAKLDIANLETQRLQLVAERMQAIAVLEELQNGARSEDIAAAQAEVQDLQAQLQLEELRRDRRASLWREGAISREQFDEVAFASEALAERLAAAQSRLEELLAGTRREQLAAQRAVVEQLNARIADLDVTIDKSTLRSPFSGAIAARRLDEGTVVDAGQPVVRLVEATQPEVEIGIPSAVAATLKLGQGQTVQIGQQTYSGKIIAVLPEINATTRTQTVVIRLSETTSVAPEQIAHLQVTQTVPTTGFWLPITALSQGESGLWSCYVASPVLSEDAMRYQVEVRQVEVLHTESQRVLVRGALEVGDRVITDGLHRIVPGQQVRPLYPGS